VYPDQPLMSDEEDIDALGIKALKELITSCGLSTEDCIDKVDLRARAREALEAKKAKKATSSSAAPSPPSRPAERQMGGYSCLVQGPADLIAGDAGAPAADLLIIVLHGLGATNRDLVDVVPMLIEQEPKLSAARIVTVCPQAPPGPMGNAWWTFDVQSLIMTQMMPAGPQKEAAMAKMIREKPQDLDTCRARMKQLIEEARAIAGGAAGQLSPKRLVLCGFSLGAITSLDVALQMKEGEGPSGVIFMNGAPIVVDEWAAGLKRHSGLPVHITSGLNDMTLPNYSSEWVRQLLQTNGATVTHKYHPGGHEIGGKDVVQSIASFLSSRL